jgi:hypothetical protein
MQKLNLDLCLLGELFEQFSLSAFVFKSVISEILFLALVLLPCLIVIFILHFIPYHFHIIGIMLMHAFHSCTIVTETPENEPVEPAEAVETEPGVEFVIEPEENQGKQLSMIP